MFRFELLLSYQREPWIGLGGGETLTYTGAEVGVETATAVHCVPVQRQVLPLEVYICPTVGLGGKEYAILHGLTSIGFTRVYGPKPWSGKK